jgi:hypothetical protein
MSGMGRVCDAAGHAPVHRIRLAGRGQALAVERTEAEIEREPRDHQRFGYTHDAVIIEGTLTGAKEYETKSIIPLFQSHTVESPGPSPLHRACPSCRPSDAAGCWLAGSNG